MKRLASVLLLSSIATCASAVSPFAVSGSSSTFVVDTRSAIAISDVTSTYCSGRYGGQGGWPHTFISGVRCEIEFKIHTSVRDNRPVDHYLVNGQRQDAATFMFDVGTLSPGDRLTVIAVDQENKMSKPFRVNIEIATAPPMWASPVYLTQIVAEPDPVKRRIVYRAPEYRGFSLFEAYTDAVELGEDDDPLNLNLDIIPVIKLWQTADSSTAQYCEGGDLGLSGGSYGRKERLGRFGGLSIMAGFTGGAVFQYNPHHQAWFMNSAELGVKYDGSWKIRQRIPSCPFFYVELGLASSGSFVLRQRRGEWYGDLSLKPLIDIVATAGGGVDVVAQAEVSGKIGLDLTAEVPKGLESIVLHGQVAWRLVLIGFEWTGTWWEGQTYLYPWGGPQASAKALAGPRLRGAAPQGNDSGLKPISRDYGDGTVPMVRLPRARAALRTGGVADNPQLLMHDGYPTPQPSVAVSGTDAALAYVRDKASRADLDRTMLVVRDEAFDGSWDAETPVWDDGTADFQPKLALLADGTAAAAWANAKRTFADGTPFGTVCAALEIAVGVRDAQSGAWTCANLTDDAALDWVPVLKGATNGTFAVAWVRNAAGAYIGTAAQPSDLVVSFHRNGSWTAPAIVAAGAGAVLSHDIAWDGDKAVLVWAADADGDLMTEDSEIWAKSFANGVWSAPVRLSATSAGAMRPYVWFLGDGTPHVVWVQDGSLFAAGGLAAAGGAAVATPEDASIPDDFRLSVRDDASATLLWTTDPATSASSLEGGIVSAAYAAGAGIAAPASLLHAQAAMRNLSGALDDDGTFRVAYESVSVSTNAAGQLVRGAVDLAVHRVEGVTDVGVAAEDCSFATNVVVGVTNVIRVAIQNFGTMASSPVVWRVWAGEGDGRELLASGQTSVPPLSRVTEEAPWTPSEGLSSVAFTIEVDPDSSIADADRTNNTLLWRPDVGSPAISFRNAVAVRATDNLRLISARIHNDSVAPVPAGMAVKFWRGEIGGPLIGTDTAGLVAGGNAGEYDVGIAWDISREAFTSEWEKVVIELPAELGGRSVSVWTTTPLYVDDDEGGDNPGGGGTGGGNTPSQPPDIVGGVGFAVVEGRTVFNLSFQGEAGFTYLLQYKRTLADPTWTTLQTVSPSATGTVPVAIPILPDTPSAFFRVVVAE